MNISTRTFLFKEADLLKKSFIFSLHQELWSVNAPKVLFILIHLDFWPLLSPWLQGSFIPWKIQAKISHQKLRFQINFIWFGSLHQILQTMKKPKSALYLIYLVFQTYISPQTTTLNSSMKFAIKCRYFVEDIGILESLILYLATKTWWSKNLKI